MAYLTVPVQETDPRWNPTGFGPGFYPAPTYVGTGGLLTQAVEAAKKGAEKAEEERKQKAEEERKQKAVEAALRYAQIRRKSAVPWRWIALGGLALAGLGGAVWLARRK